MTRLARNMPRLRPYTFIFSVTGDRTTVKAYGELGAWAALCNELSRDAGDKRKCTRADIRLLKRMGASSEEPGWVLEEAMMRHH